MHFRPFLVFWAYFFLSGKSADPSHPSPPLSGKYHYFLFLKPSLTVYKVLKKKIVEFSTKRGGGVRIGQFSTKKNNCSKHWKWPKMHFKTNLFFSIFGEVRGHLTMTDHLKLLMSLVKPSCNCPLTRIIQNPIQDM